MTQSDNLPVADDTGAKTRRLQYNERVLMPDLRHQTPPKFNVSSERAARTKGA